MCYSFIEMSGILNYVVIYFFLSMPSFADFLKISTKIAQFRLL